MIGFLVIVALFTGFLEADDITCPDISQISIKDGVTGSIPKGATSMFQVPTGFAVQLKISLYYPVSTTTFYDYFKFDYFYIASGADQHVEWYMGEEDLLVIFSTPSGNLTFYADYSYVDVSGYTQVIKKTGEYFNSTLEAGKYYTVRGAAGDTVTYNLARRTAYEDPTISNVFMFDGPDISTASYIGRLSQWTKLPSYFESSTNNFTFLNLYGTSSDTFILGNDFSVINSLPQYNVDIITPENLTTGIFHNRNLRDDDAYYTFICDGCDSFYIDGLTFVDRNPQASPGYGYLLVSGMAPTQGLAPVLNYTYSTTTNMSLPQLIPSSMATFHSYKSNIYFLMSTTSNSSFYTPQNRKTRSVSSPTLWNPAADPNFDYTFSDPVKMFNFSINLESVQLVDDGDTLLVEVATTDGDMSLRNTYSKISLMNVGVSGVGCYLNLKYSGGKNSQVIVSFEEIEVTVSTTLTSTVPPSTITSSTVTPTVAPTTTVTTTVPSTTSLIASTTPLVTSTVIFTVPTTQVTSEKVTTVSTVTSTILTTTSEAFSCNSYFSLVFLLILNFLFFQ